MKRTTLFTLVGFALLALPFVPLQAIFGTQLIYEKGVYSPVQWLLGSAIVCGLSFSVTLLVPNKFLNFLSLQKITNINAHVFISVAILTQLIVLTFISSNAFKHYPMLVDSVVQLFQAKIFASGMIYAPAPEYPQFFVTQHMLVDEQRWYSQYPPGYSALLALGVLAGAPWIVDVLLSILTTLVFFVFIRRVYSEATAKICTLLLLCCPFFMFMSTGFMNHVPTLLGVSAALLGFAVWEQEKRISGMVICGASLGFALLSRPLCALTTGCIIAAFGISQLREKDRYKGLALGVLSLLLCSLPLFLFNVETTGSIFLPGYIKLWGQEHGLGFHVSPWGDVHTPWSGLAKQLFNLTLLNEYLFEWPIPALLPLALLLIFGQLTTWDKRLAALLFAYPAVYFFYWHRDSFLGPRFIYCSLLPGVILTVRGFEELSSLAKGLDLNPPKFIPKLKFRHFINCFVSICILYALTLGIPGRLYIYNSGLRSMKFDYSKSLQEQGIVKGVLFYPVSWGARMIATMRGMGVRAATIESIYRRSDHCKLHHLLLKARQEHWQVARLENELLGVVDDTVLKPKISNDKTLRLNPNSVLTEECKDELKYDSQGFGIYLPQFVLNDPSLEPPLIFAIDLREQNSLLRNQYPDLPAYIFRNGHYVEWK